MYDSLQSAVVGLLCIGVHRKVAISYMIDALNFLQNQAGVVPQKVLLENNLDSIQITDVVARVRAINRAFESGIGSKGLQQQKISFIEELI